MLRIWSSNVHQGETVSDVPYPRWCWLSLTADSFDLPPPSSRMDAMASLPAAATSTSAAPDQPELDDIKLEWHPSSGRPSEVHHFAEYQQAPDPMPPPPDEEPWRPFRSRLDFEFAELALKARLTKAETDTLFRLCHRAVAGERFTLRDHAEVCETWEAASFKCTPFEVETITMPYGDEDHSYEVHYRPLWNWALDLLQEEHLIPYWHWDAQRCYKFNGSHFTRFLHEPWTADRWWDIQSSLPKDGKPLCFILYADKTKLSSFGTEMGYPVVARIANLDIEVRNGNGVGGGRVVGWLPIVKESPKDSGKSSFADFKQIVWHEAFYKLLTDVEKYARTGYAFECADKIIRLLFPIILILSADYEEQCVMALIRGFRGLCPCPICLVPADKLNDISQTHELRTTATMRRVYESAKNMKRVDAEKLLKSYGLRAAFNVFWKICLSDPYLALCFDRLHAYHGGLFGRHIWPQLKEYVEDLGRTAGDKLDKQMSEMPRWRDFNHFDQVMKTKFTDGSKYEDMSKMLLFAIYNLFDRRQHPHVHLLLQCLRTYLEVDAYLALEVHTEETIGAGEHALDKFSRQLQNWEFPKAHTHKHVFSDIRTKGATRVYNTKINEKLHGPIKESYHHSNFKEVAGQILKQDHWAFVSDLIREQVKYLDKFNEPPDEYADVGLKHITLGSPQPPVSFRTLEEQQVKDPAFKNFRIKLGKFLSVFLPAHGIRPPQDRMVRFSQLDKIKEHRFVKVTYESMVDWRAKTDYLRCSPDFYRHERYDTVIVSTVAGNIFAKLVYVFTCMVEGRSYPLALVQPLDAASGILRQTDKDLGFHRLREKHRIDSEFISLETIVRGAFVAPDFNRSGDFFPVDVIDGDMFLRLKEMYNN
ncbi:hypothetical protein GLOTRDRAFT_103193 [Gloeophyllum trabeum ATCC 11539]|uniref:Uncharacterized protein n=1 Tax=Gloeophyllum trabeum (strain ATCC 11539 / FP-39264 / Madison 617) TaxID=670483 RepID=S7QIL3_GLOTA|nr:uncharacterized protein GLOTRDRAFT_103193 [Gloeophyllum trabeum ATCC 11539]EPQ59138.1 hypothetical protein GLOTRDRAFT_103193 [Gloeophyllum trabeum ATCC 11539]